MIILELFCNKATYTQLNENNLNENMGKMFIKILGDRNLNLKEFAVSKRDLNILNSDPKF